MFSVIKLRQGRRRVLMTLGMSAALAFGAASLAGAAQGDDAALISSEPSAATPHCAVDITGRSVGPEKCVSSMAQMAKIVPAQATVISIDYADAGFQGASLTNYATGNVTCRGFPNYAIRSMPRGWNDIISSYRDFANCSNNPHWEHNGFRGAVVNCGPICRYVGDAMNDRTSSEQWGSR